MQVVPPEEEEVSLTFQLWQLLDPVQSIWKKHDHILPPLWSESVGQTPLNLVGTILTNTTVWAPRNSHNPYWLLLYNLVSNEITRIDFPGSEPLNGRKVWPCLDYAENLDIPWLESDADEKEHKRLLARNSIIEKRKEDQERQQLEMESEEGQKRLKLQKLNEEAEQKRLAAELEERRKQRILREIEERELEEAQALLEGTEKRMKKGKKKPLLDGEKVTKQYVMERALTEQVKERQEMERKLQKLAKTMDYLERAKREEAAPLIEAAYQRRLVEEREFYEREQQREVELSKERHESDLKEKNRLSRMLDNKEIFQAQVISRRQAEFDRIRAEKEERISQVIQARKQEREIKRKQIYYLTCEEERIAKLREYE